MPKNRSQRPDEHRPEDPSGTLDQYRLRALRRLLLTAGVTVPVVALALFLRDGITPLTLGISAMSALVWCLGWLFQRGRVVLAAHGLVLTVLLAATVSTVLTGGVRSAGVFVLLAAMALASTFLSRGKMIAVVLYAIAALGVINWLEQRGMLPGTLPPTGWTVWVIQTAVIAMVLVSALAGQYRLQEAFRTQEEALALAREAETALRASQEHFRALFRNNPAACMVQSMDTRLLLDANEAYVQMSGFPAEELVGHQPPQLWADPAEERAFRATLKTHGRVSGMHARGLRRDGSCFDSMVYAELIQQGNERLMIGMVLDMSAEERSRKALQQSEERFSKAFSFSPLGMVICRLHDGLYLEVNQANERVLGYRPDELLGRTSQDMHIWLSETDRLSYTRQLQRQGQVLGFATRLRNRQGGATDVQLWSQVIELNGEACELSYTINVSEEKRREALLMSVAEGVSAQTGAAYFLSLAQHRADAIGADGVVIGEIGAQDRIDTLALIHEGDLQPNRSLTLQHTTYAPMLLQEGPLFIETGSRHLQRPCPPFDHTLVEGLAGMALRDADGSPVGLLAVVWRQMPDMGDKLQALLTIFASRCNAELLRLRRDREISQLQATLEQRVARRTEQLQYLNRELETFSYSVSHDLKSPLRSIDGFLHLLREQLAGRLTPLDEDLVQRVSNAVSRMNSLINDLLALARVSQGQLQRMDVNLSELAEDVIRQERHRDPTREVEVVIPPGLMANCDPRLAHIVLENLIGNAWKYSRHQPVARIELGRCMHAQGSSPGFFVRDNGAGFEMSRADRLFKPFTRLHSPSEFEGSGIGLATVRRIIERHGGQIRGEGKTGEGAMFCFSFGSDAS